MVPLFFRLPNAAASRRVGLAIPALLLAMSALAQSTAGRAERQPNPLDPKAPVPALAYRSSLKPAGPAAGDQPIPWREANEAVARIGGWRVYAREAQAPVPAAEAASSTPAAATPKPPPSAAPAAPAARAAPTGHSGHLQP